CALPPRKPRRPSARRLSGNVAAMAGESNRAARGNRHRAFAGNAGESGGGAMKQIAKLKIRRGADPGADVWETFEVPFEPGQCVQGMHDGARWRDRLRLHRAARAARDESGAAFQQTARARSGNGDRAAGGAVFEMTQRKPVAFGDMRGWIAALKAQHELQEID